MPRRIRKSCNFPKGVGNVRVGAKKLAAAKSGENYQKGSNRAQRIYFTDFVFAEQRNFCLRMYIRMSNLPMVIRSNVKLWTISAEWEFLARTRKKQKTRKHAKIKKIQRRNSKCTNQGCWPVEFSLRRYKKVKVLKILAFEISWLKNTAAIGNGRPGTVWKLQRRFAKNQKPIELFGRMF